MNHPRSKGDPVPAPDAAGSALLRNRAAWVVAILGPLTAAVVGIVALATSEPALLLWMALGVAASLMAAVQMRLHREDPAVIVLFVAIGVAVAARFSPESSIPGVVAAVATISIVVIAVLERHRRGAFLALGIFAMLGVALLRGPIDPGRVAGFIWLVAAGGGSWALLDRLVMHMHAREVGYRQLFDRVPVGLYRTGLGGELLEINPAFADLLGATRESLVGRRASELMIDREDFARLRARIGTGPDPVVTDLRFRREDGAVVWLRDVTRPVLDEHGSIVCFEGEIQDVTKQRRHLEELETLVRSKSELIGAVSHELRTPLTAVVGFLDLLVERNSADGIETEAGHLIRMAAEQANDMAGIVEDLLTAARLDNRELVVQVDPIDLGGVVGGALNSLSHEDRPKVVVRVPPGLFVVADASRVRQILRNLLVNAHRYGSPPVAVEARLRDGSVELVVSDHGAEMHPEVSARMWDPFYSGSEGESAQPGSMGLGLAVSQRLATLMGGGLDHRRVDGCTQFVLTMPAWEQSQLKSA